MVEHVLEGKKIGFVGGGMMGEAIIRGLLGTGVARDNVCVSEPDEARAEQLVNLYGIHSVRDNASLVGMCDLVVLAVKPHVVPTVLSQIAPHAREDQVLISIAAGVRIETIEGALDVQVPVVRVMPNTPCLIGEGASAIAGGQYATQSHLDVALGVFGAVGRAVIVPEDKLDAVTGLSGSGPAYVYTFIEALADGGVRMGLPRGTAVLLAAQTVIGSAKMVIETGMHTAELRDKVTTPGGTTIAGLASLERDGFRAAAIEAVTAASIRSAELGRPHGK